MKPIDIFKKQYAEARATQLRFAEKGLQSALMGANQSAAQARTILDAARFDDENHKESQFVLATEKLGFFEKAFGLNAKTTAAAKKEANKIIESNNTSGTAVIFFECNAVLIKEAKKWSDVNKHEVADKKITTEEEVAKKLNELIAIDPYLEVYGDRGLLDFIGIFVESSDDGRSQLRYGLTIEFISRFLSINKLPYNLLMIRLGKIEANLVNKSGE